MLRKLLVCALLLSMALTAYSQPQQPAQKPADSKDAPKKTEPWDVEADHGPCTLVEFDTDEGTWMSCDVSPDGQWLVFDLLGDIYKMPIGGGKAELLSGGVSWECQPRFSPDGKLIVFTTESIIFRQRCGKKRCKSQLDGEAAEAYDVTAFISSVSVRQLAMRTGAKLRLSQRRSPKLICSIAANWFAFVTVTMNSEGSDSKPVS